ncbi:type II toxin-antitoxin system RelE family toxin [Streptomyces beijiangensis]|uniref:Type II toxin-antitoxin system RelE/ParE family toxin n=1 Tax=Streptomyces beijiangensis TaxID=163361 RepID=A0A939JLU9_9ACTN|nr:type II toxin-antitoxin system RelE/ParE family toxin [Streptomyces beijiangensis]MBO0516109.1 type II toxin-antitoxin system RelE/ParE family toxin [Streptomyces beijiangensis]
MTYEIIWEPRATHEAVRFLKDDPVGLSALYEAVDLLATQPRPIESTPYGSADVRRLHVGDYRVLYLIDEDVIRILVTQLGRTT